MRRIMILSVMFFGVWSTGGMVQAESALVLLEKGIYEEETAGNIDAAMGIYQKIIADEQANRQAAAQAYYRLGKCYQKKGESVKAVELFQKLIVNYPEQKALIAKVQKFVPAAQPGGVPGDARTTPVTPAGDFTKPVKIEPAPWQDGEVMKMRVNTISGLEIGTLIWTAKSIQEAEKDLWRIESFMTIPISNMEQFTRVDAEKENFLPVFGRTNQNQLGDYKTVYAKDKVNRARISEKDGKKVAYSFGVDKVVYDNEQALYLIRRMPLKLNYTQTFQILPIERQSPVKCQVSVTRQEKIIVHAGTYDCYKLELSVYSGGERMLQHTLWFSADEHKYLVKCDAGQTMMELAEVSQMAQDQPVKFSDKEMGVSLTAPAGWFFYENPAPAGKYKFMLYLLGPEMKAWSLLTVSEKGDASQSVRDIVEGDIEVLKGYFKNYVVRKDSMKEMTISGLPAIRYIADYEDNEQKKVEYRTYILGHSHVYWFVFRIDTELFEKNKKEFDAIVDSFKAKAVYTPPKRVTKADKLESEKFSAQGWKLWRERKLSEAEELFEKAVDKYPKNTNAWNGLGWSQFQQGMYENGIVAFEKCIALDPKHAAALNGLGFIAKTQGKTDKAIGYWERAVNASPYATASLSGLTQTYMELKQYDKAVKYYKKWLAVEPNNAEAKAGLEKAKAMIATTKAGTVSSAELPHDNSFLIVGCETEMKRVMERKAQGNPWKDKIDLNDVYTQWVQRENPSSTLKEAALQTVSSYLDEHKGDPEYEWRVYYLLAVMSQDINQIEQADTYMKSALKAYPVINYNNPAKESKYQHIMNDHAAIIWKLKGVEAAEAYAIEELKTNRKYEYFFSFWWMKEYEKAGMKDRLPGLLKQVHDAYDVRIKKFPERAELYKRYQME
jgi:tetratricopeptide (TPR) repeat protein